MKSKWINKVILSIHTKKLTKAAFLNSLERIKKPANAFIAIVTAVSTIVGAVSITVKYKLYSWEGIQENFLDIDNRIKLQKVLKKTATETKADRAFFFYYDRLPNGELVSVFRQYYQWQKEGQTPIFAEKYPITPGADAGRQKAIARLSCNEVVVRKLSANDALGIALKNSNVAAQVSCPVIDVLIDGKARSGVISVEFKRERTYNKTRVEDFLWKQSADVLKIFN